MAGGTCTGVRASRPTNMFCLSDFEEFARSQLDRNAWGYFSSGADAEQTLRDNEQAYSRYIHTLYLI